MSSQKGYVNHRGPQQYGRDWSLVLKVTARMGWALVYVEPDDLTAYLALAMRLTGRLPPGAPLPRGTWGAQEQSTHSLLVYTYI